MSVPATLRGYRTQYLYTLYRILNEDDPRTFFRPEGKEDLDIKFGNGYTELVQVKNLSKTLTFSDLQSKGKTTSFFQRLYDERVAADNVSGRIVSFGNIGQELTDKKKLTRKIRQFVSFKKNKQNEAKILTDSISIINVNEDDLYSSCSEAFSERFLGMNPEVGIMFLLQWIYECAERQLTVRFSDVQRQLSLVGEFIANKKNFDSTFGKDIKPFSSIDVNRADISSLYKDFYNGASACYQDILKGLDVIRSEKLEEINKDFLDSSVVIVHGASGQGKSTLAYQYVRYMHGEEFSYFIPHLNESNLNGTVTTLQSLIYCSKIPLLVYLDVLPGNNLWVQFVKRFRHNKNIRILLTIREEDWNRTKNLLEASGDVKELDLSLDSYTAQKIYKKFSEIQVCKIKTFKEAWYNYGEGRSLLEFVYVLTHGEPLEKKIKAQIDNLVEHNDELSVNILRYVAIADCFAGGIHEDSFKALLKDNALYKRKFSYLENEYFFVRDNRNYLRGLHPLRSKFVLEAISMNDKSEIIEAGLNMFEAIDDESKEVFLQNLIKVGMTKETLFAHLNEFNLNNPYSYLSLLKISILLGILHYKKVNEKVIGRFEEQFNILWPVAAGINFSSVDTDDALSHLSDDQGYRNVLNLRKSLTAKEHIFDYAKDMLSSYSANFIQKSGGDVYAIGEVLFYQGFLKVGSCQIEGEVNPSDSSLTDLATLLLGLNTDDKGEWGSLINHLQGIFLKRLRTAYNIIRLDITDKEIISFSIMDYDDSKIDKTKGTIYEQHNLEIIDLCRLAYPDKLRYTSRVVKDLWTEFIGESFLQKSISIENLPLEELTSIPNMLSGMTRYQLSQSSDTDEYFEDVEERWLRYKNKLAKLTGILQKLVKSGLRGVAKDLDMCHNEEIAVIKLNYIDIPRSEIDSLGLGSKFKDRSAPLNSGDENITDSNKDFKSKMVNFNGDFKNLCVSINYFYYQYYEALFAILKGSEDKAKWARLSVYNLQETISSFYKIKDSFDFVEYFSFDEDDEKVLINLWLVWSAVRRGKIESSYNVNRNYANYQRDKAKLIEGLVSYLHSTLENEGINNRVLFEAKRIKIFYWFTSSENIKYYGDVIVRVLHNRISEQTPFSTTRLIEHLNIEAVELYPFYESHAQSMSINGSYSYISWIQFLDKDHVPDNFAPNTTNSLETWKDVNLDVAACTECGNTIETLLTLWSSVESASGSEPDSVGSSIITKRLERLSEQALQHGEVSFAMVRKALEAIRSKDQTYNQKRDDQISMLSYFEKVMLKLKAKDDSWLDERLPKEIENFYKCSLDIDMLLIDNSSLI